MAEYRSTEVAFVRRRFDWGSIWGGVFCFIAIWTVFGALGLAIFATVTQPAASKFDMGLGIGIYAIVLTVVAMFIAGSATGRLAGVSTRLDGFYHGLVLYGLVLVCAFVLASLGGGLSAAATNAATGGAAAENAANAAQNAVNNAAGTLGSYPTPYIMNLLTTLGWGGFISLFLAFVAAVAGAASAVAPRVVEGEIREIRPAA